MEDLSHLEKKSTEVLKHLRANVVSSAINLATAQEEFAGIPEQARAQMLNASQRNCLAMIDFALKRPDFVEVAPVTREALSKIRIAAERTNWTDKLSLEGLRAQITETLGQNP